MYSPPSPQLKFNITPLAGGVLLKIWEPAARDEVRVKPFLFMLRYRMNSEDEARRFIASYRSFYNSGLVQNSHRSGKLSVKEQE